MYSPVDIDGPTGTRHGVGYTRGRKVNLMAARTVLTYADYVAIPEDGRRYELRDGELSMMPASGTRPRAFFVTFSGS